MFRIILTLIVIASITWLWTAFRHGQTTVVKLWQQLKEEFLVFKEFPQAETGQILVKLRKATYLLTLTLFLILAISAYLQVLISDGPLTGWLLIVHVTSAPLFALSLMLTVLLWAHRQRFNQQDWLYLQQIIKQKRILLMRNSDTAFWYKLIFWIFVLSAIPAILSIILQLYPIFGSAGMESLLIIHRYSTLILFVVVVIHGYLLLQRLNN